MIRYCHWTADGFIVATDPLYFWNGYHCWHLFISRPAIFMSGARAGPCWTEIGLADGCGTEAVQQGRCDGWHQGFVCSMIFGCVETKPQKLWHKKPMLLCDSVSQEVGWRWCVARITRSFHDHHDRQEESAPKIVDYYDVTEARLAAHCWLGDTLMNSNNYGCLYICQRHLHTWSYMYITVYIYIYTHCIYIYIYALRHMYTYIFTYMYTDIQIYRHTDIQAYRQTYRQADRQPYTHTYIYIYTL